MERPYNEAQVFELQMVSVDIAKRLHDPTSPLASYRRLDEDVLEAIEWHQPLWQET